MALAVVVGAAILLALIVQADVMQLLAIARETAPGLLALPILATIGSYVTMARSYQGIAAAAGWRLAFADMLRITLLANTANYLLSTGGLSGFALRMYLFTRRGVPAGSAVLISLVQTLLTNLVLLVVVFIGFVLLLGSAALSERDLVAAAVLLGAFTVTVVAACIAMLRRPLRRRLLAGTADLLDRTLQRFTPDRRPQRPTLLKFQHSLDAGIDFFLERPHEMLLPTWYIVLDWILTLLVLYTAFIAIGHPVAASHVIAGFAIGMFFSTVSLIPGGLGVLDGSMAAVFSTLGVPLEQSVVAILIFRAAYYGLPIAASLLVARPAFR